MFIVLILGSVSAVDIEVTAQSSETSLSPDSIEIEPPTMKKNPENIELYKKNRNMPQISASISPKNYSEPQNLDLNASIYRNNQKIIEESADIEISEDMIQNDALSPAPLRLTYRPEKLGAYILKIEMLSSELEKEKEIPVNVIDKEDAPLSRIDVKNISLDKNRESVTEGQNLEIEFMGYYSPNESDEVIEVNDGLNIGETEVLINGESKRSFNWIGDFDVAHKELKEAEYAENGEWKIRQEVGDYEDSVSFEVHGLEGNIISQLLEYIRRAI